MPFSKFSGVDIVLGPEMKSTGEVMGIAATFGEAFAKSQSAANSSLPKQGKVFISVRDEDKRSIVFIAKKLFDMGFGIVSTSGTAKVLKGSGVAVEEVNRYDQGQHGKLMQMIKQNEIKLIINTPSGESTTQYDMRSIRAAAILHNVPCITTLQGAWAAVNGIEFVKSKEFTVKSLQEYYKENKLTGSPDTRHQSTCSFQ